MIPEFEDWNSAPAPASLDNKIKETVELGQSQLFYKYKPLGKFTERMITHRELWFSHPSKFNDPFEFSTAAKVLNKDAFFKYSLANNLPLESVEDHWQKYDPMTIEEKKDYIINVNKTLNETSRVFSMSLIPDSILMWAYYGQEHEGVCFGFDIMESLETFGFSFKVEYPDTLERPFLGNLDSVDNVGDWNKHYTKAKCWEHEQEIRVYRFGENCNIWCYKHQSLKQIIFGCSANDETIKRYSSLVSNKEGF